MLREIRKIIKSFFFSFLLKNVVRVGEGELVKFCEIVIQVELNAIVEGRIIKINLQSNSIGFFFHSICYIWIK